MTADSDSSEPKQEGDPEVGAHHVTTNERVPGHANYYEKDGLRTYGGDDVMIFRSC
jgi:hypothetical protein